MIYEPAPEATSPVRQGDIFINVPLAELTADPFLVLNEDESFRSMTPEAFAVEGSEVTALLRVRPVTAVVGTQECDGLRARDITLFEVRPFAEVEGKAKSANSPKSWTPIITQHARVNQKWFYLPPDERVGFAAKMGVNFLSPARVPRTSLEAMRGRFRVGRLGDVASQHFRERLSEFFRRYAYDEWYPLTPEEFEAYARTHEGAEPFPWQRRGETGGES